MVKKITEEVRAGQSEKYTEREIDHRELTLFRAYRSANLWAEAKQIAENSFLSTSKEPRIKVLKKEIAAAGLNYDDI